MIVELHFVNDLFVVVILYLVWFMVVMVIPPRSSSKQAWPALGGSTKEQRQNLPIWSYQQIHSSTKGEHRAISEVMFGSSNMDIFKFVA